MVSAALLRKGGAFGTKKPGQKCLGTSKYGLTNKTGWYTMVFHTVILCPSMGILPNMVILPQDMVAVKKKVEHF
jgi:hypothetical protein